VPGSKFYSHGLNSEGRIRFNRAEFSFAIRRTPRLDRVVGITRTLLVMRDNSVLVGW